MLWAYLQGWRKGRREKELGGRGQGNILGTEYQNLTAVVKKALVCTQPPNTHRQKE